MAAGNAVGNLQLVGAEADAISTIAQPGVETSCGRLHTSGILHRAIVLLDSDDVERRIREHLRDAQRVGMAIDLRRLAGLQMSPSHMQMVRPPSNKASEGSVVA